MAVPAINHSIGRISGQGYCSLQCIHLRTPNPSYCYPAISLFIVLRVSIDRIGVASPIHTPFKDTVGEEDPGKL